ncbi:MAG TPA: peptide chain release factor N(5)-glutamine methyltransferase, partial [Chitinophagaceae bacterium]|nr:peptide chain release factor N(5)-glutamine methyltransferase [Chitinophagaceae bacterium]
YDDRESSAIADWILEHLTGWKKSDRMIYKKSQLREPAIEKLQSMTQQLLAHKPVQYVLKEAYFHGMKLYVDKNVLIPRPETEELVQWTIDEVYRLRFTVSGSGASDFDRTLRVLDVGTGSGCIPISLKKEMPRLEIYACDISEGALSVAKKNADEQKAAIEFKRIDFLNETERSTLPQFDLIVSNPPYISVEEKETIHKHVIEYEPHLALFVPEDDSLIFYRALADFGESHLKKGGCMIMEIHFEKGKTVRDLFGQRGYETELRKDMHGNDRMIKAWHS